MGKRLYPWGKGNVRLQVIVSREQAKHVKRIARQQKVSLSAAVQRMLALMIAAQPSTSRNESTTPV